MSDRRRLDDLWGNRTLMWARRGGRRCDRRLARIVRDGLGHRVSDLWRSGCYARGFSARRSAVPLILEQRARKFRGRLESRVGIFFERAHDQRRERIGNVRLYRRQRRRRELYVASEHFILRPAV